MGGHLMQQRWARQDAERAKEPPALQRLKRNAAILKRNQPGLRHHEALHQVSLDAGYASFHAAREAIMAEVAQQEPGDAQV